MTGLSIVVPTYNEAGNVIPLVERIAAALRPTAMPFEVIVVDDRSTDATAAEVEELRERYPVQLYTKKGSRGKAFSLLEGFAYARYDCIAMLDADLQYPPEALPAMLDSLERGADVVVARRHYQNSSFSRRVLSRLFLFTFGTLLFGLRCDVQSGQKLFRREVLATTHLNPSPWTFDLEFLVQARQSGYTIASVPVEFTDRTRGESKINVARASWELAIAALKLRFRPRHADTAPNR